MRVVTLLFGIPDSVLCLNALCKDCAVHGCFRASLHQASWLNMPCATGARAHTRAPVRRLLAAAECAARLGQWLSSRRDLFSTEMCDAMGVLHEHAIRRIAACRVSPFFVRNTFARMMLDHLQVTAEPLPEDAALVEATAPGASLDRIFACIWGFVTVAQHPFPGPGILGAGCIARVYQGSLDGRPVAIKIRRDNVEEFLQLDFQFLRHC